MHRRHFLASSGALLGAGALAAARLRARADDDARPDPSLASWSAVRALFDLDPELAHLAGFFLASHPRPVRDAIERYRRELDLDPVGCWLERHVERDAAVAVAAARYLGVEPEDVALTDSTTMGLGLVYTGMRLAEGDEILTSEHDHYSTRTALAFGATRTGARVVHVPFYADSRAATRDEIVASILSGLSPRTRLVALTWVHSKTGLQTPVRAIADAVAEATADRPPADRPLVCVDAVHGLGAVPGAPPDLGCDVLVAGTHKWMLGPRGTGIVWAHPDAWPRIAPTIPPFGPHDEPGTLHTPGGFHSFEHRWALDEAFTLHERIGKHRVTDRIRELNAPILDALAAMPHVRLLTPAAPDLTSGIVCFQVDGERPRDVVAALAERRVVASVSPYQPPCARLSASLVVEEDGVERAIAAVGELG